MQFDSTVRPKRVSYMYKLPMVNFLEHYAAGKDAHSHARF
jgi:hypothetical protein